MKTKHILFTYITLLFFPPLVAGEEIDIVIENHIKTELSEIDREGFEVQGSKLADLNNDKKQEIVFVWTRLGPTYWKNYLTILKNHNGKYVHSATFALNGLASLEKIKNNKIIVSQTVYAPEDPICCPSIDKKITYTFKDDDINKEQ